jgi:hypothetical protein
MFYNMPSQSKERGMFLTFMLAFGMIGTIASIPQLISHDTLARASPWYKLWLTLYTVSDIAIYIGIWRWKRIAVYAFFLLGGLQILLISTVVRQIYNTQPISIIALALLHGVWLWAIKRKWHLFAH